MGKGNVVHMEHSLKEKLCHDICRKGEWELKIIILSEITQL